MDDVTLNTLEFILSEWVKNSLLFRDPQKWLEGLKQELAEIPRLEEEVKALSLEIDLRLQGLLFDENFTPDEIFKLMRLPTTAIDIIDSTEEGFEGWKRARRNSQPWPPMTLSTP